MLPERYVPKKVSKISKTDRKVSIVGRVAEQSDDSLVIEDDSGKIEIFLEKESAESIEIGKAIRTFCSLVGEHLKLDFAQGLDGLDINLLKTVEELYEKAGI